MLSTNQFTWGGAARHAWLLVYFGITGRTDRICWWTRHGVRMPRPTQATGRMDWCLAGCGGAGSGWGGQGPVSGMSALTCLPDTPMEVYGGQSYGDSGVPG